MLIPIQVDFIALKKFSDVFRDYIRKGFMDHQNHYFFKHIFPEFIFNGAFWIPFLYFVFDIFFSFLPLLPVT
jgi:hypothetical protein